ncbi:unnamed protein product [Paramecium primaurelia]|uniref:Transmembrane protein n=1 Tax=Paramecium primaurelia TaxID=5886 RepID=A0A8S1QD67_PARPR|nr:unnamed protein product [Paramecium primaurelia]
MTKVQFLLTQMIILAYQCSYLNNNTIFLTGTLQEVINVPLSSIFHHDDYERITLKQPNKYLTIETPISKYSEIPNNAISNSKTISQKLQKSTLSRDPLNHITILVVVNGIYYIESNIGYYQNLPVITSINQCKTKTQSICYDVILIDKLTIAECEDEQKNSYLIIINSTKTSYLDIDKPISDFRKMDQIDNYMFRGTANKIYIYIEEENNLKYLNTLDENTLKELLKKDSFKLLIKDFQIHTNVQLSIMNAYGEIIIVQYQNNSWNLIKIIETKLNDVQGYDYNIYTNTYGIISKNKILYQNRDQEQQIADIQNQDVLYKIYITKKNILLFNNNTVTLLNQKLKKIYNLKFDDEEIFINTNPNAEGFIFISNTRVAAYAINDNYSLQLSLISTISDNYQKATLIQESYPKNCEIIIFYKTEDFGYSKILQSQYSQGLIAGGINIDSNEINIRPIFQGSNLKYQFQANSLIKIEIDKHKIFQINGVSENQELGYRKILKGNGEKIFYLIQEDADLQMKGYLCVGNLELSCKVLFTNDNFKQLQNSFEQLWWSNNESLFFATFVEKIITIYSLSTQTNNFEILTTINLESNIKQIVTDGFHLFVLIEQQIKIYEITIADKFKLTNNFDIVAQKIYASQYVKNQLFIEQEFNLSLYDIEYDLQTLIWYDTIQFEQSESNLAIFKNHFLRFTKPINKDEYIVTVFNYANKRNIYMEKQILFNYYSNIKLSTLEYSFERNLFYIHGYNKQSLSQVILVYKITSNSLDTLFYQINISTSTIFSVADTYVLNTDIVNKQIENYYITGDLLITSKLNRNYQQISYTRQIQLDFEVTNDLSNKLVQSIFINSVNRGDKILSLRDKINLEYQKNNDTIKCVYLGQDWYSGQVFDIEIVNQSTKIKFNPPLTKEEEILEFSPQIQELNSSRLVQLMSNKLNLVKKEDFTYREFKLDQAYQFTDILLIVGENIYVQAETQESIWLRIIQCKDYKDCILLDNKLKVSYQMKKVFLHQNNFFLYDGKQIQVYDTKGDQTNLEQFELFQNFPQYIYIKQMEFNHLQGNVYQFISVDNWGNPEFQMREISRTSTKNYFVRFMIDSLITEQKINLQEIQLSAGFVLRKNEITIIFKNSASYSFYYEMDCSRNELCEIAKFKFNGLYQQYKDWQLYDFYPSFQSNENILLLIYNAITHYELLIYDMETPSNNTKPKNVIARLPSLEKSLELNSQIVSFIYTYNGNLHLLTSTQNQIKLQHYSLLRSYQLCTEEISFEDSMNFKISNTDQQISIEEQITIKEYVPPTPEDKGKFPIWAIIVIILGVLLIGGGIYIYYRQKKNKTQNTNLLLDS